MYSASSIRVVSRWVLPEVAGPGSFESNSARDLGVHDFGRDCDDPSRIALPGNKDLGLHPDRQVIGIALGYLRVDFEAGQIDHGHDGSVPRHGGFLVDKQVTDNPVDGGVDRQIIDLPLQVGNEQLFALDLEFTRA